MIGRVTAGDVRFDVHRLAERRARLGERRQQPYGESNRCLHGHRISSGLPSSDLNVPVNVGPLGRHARYV
jgi:hypothetical protein